MDANKILAASLLVILHPSSFGKAVSLPRSHILWPEIILELADVGGGILNT